MRFCGEAVPAEQLATNSNAAMLIRTVTVFMEKRLLLMLTPANRIQSTIHLLRHEQKYTQPIEPIRAARS